MQRILAFFILLICIACISFSPKQASGRATGNAHTPQSYADTVPSGKRTDQAALDLKRNVENAMEEVRTAQENLQRQLEKVRAENVMGNEIDMERMARISAERAAIDMKMQGKMMREELMLAAQQDALKRRFETDAMKQNEQQLESEISRSLLNRKLMAEMQTAGLANAIRAEKLAMMDMHNNRDLLEKLRFDLDEKRDELQQNRRETEGYKALVNAMQADGLIKADAYDIRYHKGELFINGKKQSKQVIDKYKPYIREDDFSIRHESRNDEKVIYL